MFELAERLPRARHGGLHASCSRRSSRRRRSGYTATRHQHEVGTGYFDVVAQVVSGGTASTLALHGVHGGGAVLSAPAYDRRPMRRRARPSRVEQASRELADDHPRLHALIDRLGRAARPLRDEREALADLHDRLTGHFNAEEKPGGLYDALGVCAPEFRQHLAELVDDHFRFAGVVRDLRERARAIGGARRATRCAADVARLLTAARRPRARELEMVQRRGAGGRVA